MDGQQNQCNITDASPHLTTRLLHLDLYSDLESRFGLASIYRNYNGIIDLRSFSIDESTLGSGLCSQGNLLKIPYWENGPLSLFCGKSKFVAELYRLNV